MIKGIVPTLSEAGKIKIGCKGDKEYPTRDGKGTYRRPVKLDHFLITRTERASKNGDFILDEELMGIVANGREKIKEIPIVLHSDDIDEVFPTKYALYRGKKIACSGDGIKACRREMVKGVYTGRKKEMKCQCDFLLIKKECKPNATLHCSIAIPGHAVAGAVYKWRTTSIISIQRMIGSLEQIKSVCGTLRGIPLWLRLEPVGVEKGTVYCCHVELRAKNLLDVQKMALELASMRAALGDDKPKLMISAPAGDDESEEESADVQEEFYPEVFDDDTGEVVEGLKKFNNNDRELWGFSEAEYEDSSSATNGTPPSPDSKPETREEEKSLKSEKVA